MNLTEKYTEIKGARRLSIAAACAAVAFLTCVSALALRMEVAAPASASATQSSGTDRTLKVSSAVMAGQRISGPNPIYPPQAKADKVQGPVVLSLKINKDGEPINVHVKQGVRSDLDESAVTAVQQWRWKPFLLNGDPIDVKTTVTVTYSLEP